LLEQNHILRKFQNLHLELPEYLVHLEYLVHPTHLGILEVPKVRQVLEILFLPLVLVALLKNLTIQLMFHYNLAIQQVHMQIFHQLQGFHLLLQIFEYYLLL
jgi:hypothetical protein